MYHLSSIFKGSEKTGTFVLFLSDSAVVFDL